MNPFLITIPSTDGVQVAVHDYGGDGPPIIFCHATGFHGRYWAVSYTHLTLPTILLV